MLDSPESLMVPMLLAVYYWDLDTVRSLFRQCVSAREEVESDTVWRGAKIFGPGNTHAVISVSARLLSFLEIHGKARAGPEVACLSRFPSQQWCGKLWPRCFIKGEHRQHSSNAFVVLAHESDV